MFHDAWPLASMTCLKRLHFSADMFGGKSIEELFGQMIAQSQHPRSEGQEGPMQSSTGQVEGMMDDELFSFLEKSLVNN